MVAIATVMACADGEPGASGGSALGPIETNCGSEVRHSSWAARDGEFDRLATYGRGEEQELIDVWGVTATPRGEILVWDAGSTQIRILSDELELTVSAGGQGEGPGEFVYQRVPNGDWITADDSSFVVLGLGTGVLSTFGMDGHFISNPTSQPPFPLPILRIQLADGELLYGVAEVDRQNGERTLETWRLAADYPHTLLRRDPMPSLPQWRGSPIYNRPMQADPLWASDGHCAYISDGSNDWILVADLATGEADTLSLPSRPAVEPTEADWALWQEMREEMRSMGFAPRGIEQVDPTARVKWANLAVDPDGFVWIEPWRPPSQVDSPVSALILNPRTGAVDSVRVPRFPAAFLPSGQFISLTGAGSTPLVEKYGAP